MDIQFSRATIPAYGTIDLHCDTLSRLIRCGDAATLKQSDLQVDIAKLRQAGAAAQFFAMFVPVMKAKDPPLEICLQMIDRFYQELERWPDDIAFAGSAADIERNRMEGKISALLTIEDSGILDGSLSVLRVMHRLGVRLITLTWNGRNRVGSPNLYRETSAEGLTEHGFAFVREMERLGMLVDVSHLSDAGFYDVCRTVKGPFVASHSNARSVTPHFRNLSDDMIRQVAAHGGVIGINLYSLFVQPGQSERIFDDPVASDGHPTGRNAPVACIDDVVMHIRHIVNVGGIDCVAIGTDYDGIDATVTGLENSARLPALFEALEKAGFTQENIEKIRYRNAIRVIRDVCG